MGCHHVDAGQYVRTAQGLQPPGLLTGMILRHVIEVCPRCRETWELLPPPMQKVVQEGLARHVAPPAAGVPPAEHLSLCEPSIDDDEAAVARLRRQYNLVRFSFDKLLALEPAEWEAKIQRSKKRFRSRMMVDLMLARVREWTPGDPGRAQALAAVTRSVVRRIHGGGEEPWRAELEALALAQQANAARVAGDFFTASRLFATIHHQLADAEVDDLNLRGWLASLEAALRSDQREFEEASQQLDVATLLFRSAGDRQNSAIALIQKAALHQTDGSAEAALRCAEVAADLLGEERDCYLYLSTVTWRANALCDLDRPAEAGALLDANLDLFESSDQLHVGSMLRGIRGRVALGMGHLVEAAEHFGDAREAFLQLGRGYDAALVSLDLAETYLEAGRVEELRQEAGALVQLFRNSGVRRETLASLALLAKAAQAGALTAQVIAEVRKAISDQSMSRLQPLPP